MGTSIKTSVQVVQELLALCTTRKELLQRMHLNGMTEQDKLIGELMEELSLNGDAASASVDRSAPYFQAATDLQQSLTDRLPSSSDLQDAFKHTEHLFQDRIGQIRLEGSDLPETLENILKQLAKV